MPPRTVLYMTPSVRMLGARQSLLTLVAHLDRDRYRPLVCCQTPGALTEALDRAGVEWVCVKTGWWRKARYWPRIPFALWRLVRLVRRRGIDLIHCNEIYPNPYACLVRRWTGAPVATHMRLTVTPDMARKYWLHDADRIIVVSEAAGRDFDFWPDKDRRVRVVYNPIDASAYAVDEPREITRRRLGWTPDAFVVALVGTWTPRKRQHVAIEAVGMLAERLP
ncbi:MAG: glycosyltransferase family 4 protein, partial [Candidatus Sumerlaeota bacterium]|nr:glycosyltransferase family 4 protein [Candidatus Sumerlaeota bacterium]